jgi:hypothetical protein
VRWMRLVVRTTALAHMVVCRYSDLSFNQISIVANGTFARLTALAELYGAGMKAGLSLLLAFVVCMDVRVKALGGLFRACSNLR